MATTNFVTGTTITSDWLNDVDEAVYNPASVILPATSVTNTPAGSISATDVQAAIDELDTEKQPKDALLTALAAQTTSADKVQAYTGVDTPTLLSTGTASGNIPLVGTTSATESLAGLVELATTAEAAAGSDTVRAVTPAGVNSAIQTLNITTESVRTVSGATSVNFTSIPSWVKRIVVMLNACSTNGTSTLVLTIGPGTTPASSGYSGGMIVLAAPSTISTTVNSTYFNLTGASAAAIYHGVVYLNLFDPTNNIWTISGTVYRNDGSDYTNILTGSVALSGDLGIVRITTAGGANTFDAGTMNIAYE